MESSRRGQTVGKMAMSLRTEGPGGGNPTMEQAVKRNAWNALNAVPFVGWLLSLLAVIYIAVTINNCRRASVGMTPLREDTRRKDQVTRREP